MHRKFWIINANGDKYDMDDIENSSFLGDPTGLGATANVKTMQIGNTQLVTYQCWNFSEIGGTLYFSNDVSNGVAYDQYKKFISFLSLQPLYLHYQTPDIAINDESYFAEVVLNSITKGDVDNDTSTLICNVQFTPLTMWQSSKENIIEIEGYREKGKSYPLSRSYAYSSNSLSHIEVINESNMQIPIIIEIEGSCVNPAYSIFNSELVRYGAGLLIGTFDYVFINSDPLYEELTLMNNNVPFVNPMSYQDPSVGVPGKVDATFLFLRPGKNIIKFDFSNDFKGKVTIKWRNEYATV